MTTLRTGTTSNTHAMHAARVGEADRTATPTTPPAEVPTAPPRAPDRSVLAWLRDSDVGSFVTKAAVSVGLFASTFARPSSNGAAASTTADAGRATTERNVDATTRMSSSTTVDFRDVQRAMSSDTTLRKAMAGDPVALQRLDSLVAQPSFKSLSLLQRAVVHDAIGALGAGAGAVDSVGAFVARGSSLSASQARDGGDAWQQLRGAVDDVRQADSASAPHRRALLAGIVDDVARPGRIDQSTKGTCTVTTLQYLLATRNPAEYIRLQRALLDAALLPAGSSSSIALLGDGVRIDPGHGALQAQDGSRRTLTERLFQIAGMETGNGARLYDNRHDTHPPARDAWRSQQRVVLDTLAHRVERDLTRLSTQTGADATARGDVLRDSLRSIAHARSDRALDAEYDAKLNARAFGGGLSSRDVAALGSALLGETITYHVLTPQNLVSTLDAAARVDDGPALVTLTWSGEGAHMLAFEGVRTDEHGVSWVHMRNPWGPLETGRSGPAREVLDDNGHIRMRMSDFATHALAISFALPQPASAPVQRSSGVRAFDLLTATRLHTRDRELPRTEGT